MAILHAAVVAVVLAPWLGLGASFEAQAYYPAPYGGWIDEWVESYGKARDVVATMTLAEKANLTGGTGVFMGKPCSGNTGSVPRLGLPNLCLNDGPNGVRQADHVTAFPDGITVGATFDKQLMYQRGVAIGSEARGKGVHVWLGPSVGPIGRKPKGGRNWEAFGADPVLQGVAARETVRGVQEQGVIATIKHFVGNEQEMYRMYNPVQSAYSSNIDDRTMHELYIWPFAEAIRAGVGAAMMAYNAVNGSACSQNSYLINNLLKDELGFQGFVMTDWLGHMSGVASALAGLDMDMPGDPQIPLLGNSYWMYEMSRFILNGSVPMDRLNDMTTRILAARFKMGQDKPDYPPTSFDTNTHSERGFLYPAAFPDSPFGIVNRFVEVQGDHDVVARQIAQDAITMLKNEGGMLPLTTQAAIKVFGTDAQQNADGPNACRDRNCNKGTLGQGWGSGTVDYPYLDDPITAIKARAGNVKFHNSDSFPLILGETPNDDDVAVVFVTSDSGENTYTVEGNHGDRDASGLYLWHGGDRLVQDVAKRYKNVVVVIHTVGPLVVEEWIDLPSVKAVLVAHLPGQEAGRSLAEVLFGNVSPNGHLPYSMTRKEDDMPESVTKLIDRAFFNQPQDDYSEGLFIDYRWLNKQHVTPRFAFGHGLSYTNFTYTAATVTKITPLQQYPPVRPPKGPTLDFSQAVPSPNEAVAPSGFRRYWRYIYPWLSEADANAATDAAKTRKYPYPAEYTMQPRAGPRSGGAQGGNPALWDVAYEISVAVNNTGAVPGKASVQAYLEFPQGVGYETPVLQLRDFEKTRTLAPDEGTMVKVRLTRKDLSVWDVVAQDWVVPNVEGEYKVWVGAASDDLRLVCRTGSMACQEGVKGPV